VITELGEGYLDGEYQPHRV